MLPSVHLSPRALLRVAGGDAPLDDRARAHLADCARCRTHLHELRALGDAARALDGPAPSAALLARVHARVAAGERVILPATAPLVGAASRLRMPTLLASGVAAVLALVLWLGRPTAELSAGDLAGELHFLPAAPRAGDSVQVEYRAPAMLARERTLALRARFRTAWDVEYAHGTRQQRAALLRRGGDGTFRGAFRLPDSAVFAAFAVEDTAGRHVDSHGRALWELLVHGADGKPTYDALGERIADLHGRNMELALETARRRAALYADRPEAWASVISFERYNLGARADSLVPAHRARLARLSEAWAQRAEVPFSVVDGMLAYVVQFDGTDPVAREARARWAPLRASALATERTDREWIRSRWWRTINAYALSMADSARVGLPLAERFWAGAGRPDPYGALVGAQVARAAKDTTEVRRRWTDRYAATIPGSAEYAYVGFAWDPPLRRFAIERLTAIAEQLDRPDDARRPLELTRAEAAVEDAARARGVRAYIADALLAEGDTVRARDALARATDGGWDAALDRRAAGAQLAVGDTARGVALLARIVADPGTSSRDVDSLTTVARRAVDAQRWQALVAGARQAMRDHFLSTAVRLQLPTSVSLVDSAGTATTLDRVTAGRVSVVTFWSRYCGPSREAMRQLDALAENLGRRGMALVPITDDAPSPEIRAYLRERGVHVPVYHDRGGEARHAFGQWATPEYHVVDARGRVRFRNSSLALVVAQAVAIAEESTAAR